MRGDILKLNNLVYIVILLGFILIVTSYESSSLIKFIALTVVISSLIINYALRNASKENYN